MLVKDNFTGKELKLATVRGKLLTVREVAAFLRVSKRWIQNHMKDGTFPLAWYLIGKRDYAIDSADLDEWLRKTMVKAGEALLPLKAVKKHLKDNSGEVS
jgi:excisionase family DNA binding protein